MDALDRPGSNSSHFDPSVLNKLPLVERIMALKSPRPWQSTEECLHLQSCKMMCKEVSLSQQWLLFWHWHTHTPTHGAVIWHNHSHGADKDGDGIHSSPHGWWQSLLQQMWLNPTKAIPSAGRCHLLWQSLSNYISFDWGVGVMWWTSYKWDEPSNKGLCNPKCDVTVHYLNVRKFKLCEDC